MKRFSEELYEDVLDTAEFDQTISLKRISLSRHSRAIRRKALKILSVAHRKEAYRQ